MDRINQIWPAWHTVELIGRGGFGEVYKAKRERLGEEFYSAVKIIRIPKDESEVQEMMAEGHTSQSVRYYYESVVRGLMNEIKVLDALKSAGNVVNIEEFEILEREDSIGWDAYIRMELLQNLNTYRQNHQLNQQEVAKLGIDLCEALICCEKSHIIHRDIKPSNIFVDKYGTFKLGDFGIARQMEKTQSTLSRKGTDLYMAPEVRYGKSGSSYNVDIYSLGLVMYRLLNSNRMPFEPLDKEMMSYQEKEEALVRRLEGEKISLPVNCDMRLGKIICRACEYDKDKRYQSAAELKKDLETWIRNGSYLRGEIQNEEPVAESIHLSHVLPEAEEEKTMAAFESTTTSNWGNAKPVEEKKETARVEEPERMIQETEGNSTALTQDEENRTEKEEKQLDKKANRDYLILMACGIVPLYFVFSTYSLSYAFSFLRIEDPLVLSIIAMAVSGMLLGGIRILVKKGWCKSGVILCLAGGYFAALVALSELMFSYMHYQFFYTDKCPLFALLILPVAYKLCKNVANRNGVIQTAGTEKQKLTLCFIIPLYGICSSLSSFISAVRAESLNLDVYGSEIIKWIVFWAICCTLITIGKHLALKKKLGIVLCTAGGAMTGYLLIGNWISTFIRLFLLAVSHQDYANSLVDTVYDIQIEYWGSKWPVLVGVIGAVIVAIFCYKWSKTLWKSQEMGLNGQD